MENAPPTPLPEARKPEPEREIARWLFNINLPLAILSVLGLLCALGLLTERDSMDQKIGAIASVGIIFGLLAHSGYYLIARQKASTAAAIFFWSYSAVFNLIVMGVSLYIISLLVYEGGPTFAILFFISLIYSLGFMVSSIIGLGYSLAGARQPDAAPESTGEGFTGAEV